MEAIVALSAVTVALTVFLGLLSYAEIDGSGDPKEPDTEFISREVHREERSQRCRTEGVRGRSYLLRCPRRDRGDR